MEVQHIFILKVALQPCLSLDWWIAFLQSREGGKKKREGKVEPRKMFLPLKINLELMSAAFPALHNGFSPRVVFGRRLLAFNQHNAERICTRTSPGVQTSFQSCSVLQFEGWGGREIWVAASTYLSCSWLVGGQPVMHGWSHNSSKVSGERSPRTKKRCRLR